MDILYSGRVEGFCLVSSDSDFTRLAARLRESGMTVIGMGESKTPNSFIAACNKFKYLDILSAADEAEAEEAAPKAEPAKKPAAQPKKTPKGRRQKPKRSPKRKKNPSQPRTPHQPAHHPPGAAHHCAGELRRGQLDYGQPGGQPAGQALHGL
ncbi:MAG: NYN domain-containing protein [Acutalibacter sp.]